MDEKYVAQCEEDEIDLRELWRTIIKHKKFIIIFTLTITLIATIWSFVKTPIYEVKSNVQIGFIGDNLIDNKDVIVKKLNIIFNVEDKQYKKNKFISEVSSITSNKKLENFIEVKTQAITNDDALKKNKEVVNYLQQIYAPKINQYIINTKNRIKNIEQSIKNIDNFETKNIQRKIKLLKTQDIAKIDEKINLLKEQDIPKIQRKIKLLKTQDIAKIDEKIKFFKKIQIPILKTKIKFHSKKLKEYTKAVHNLYHNSQATKDTTTLTISSIQMVNYQNLILNSQNKIEDLKIAIDKINNETIPSLQRKQNNIQNVTIKDLEQKIDNIKNITITDLQKQKENIQNDTIRKLEHQLTVALPNKKIQLQEQIEQLKFNMSSQNIQNSHIVGHYIIHDYPTKPKKKLIVIVAFVTGLILSVFLVFFIDFIKGFKEEYINNDDSQ